MCMNVWYAWLLPLGKLSSGVKKKKKDREQSNIRKRKVECMRRKTKNTVAREHMSI